MKPSSSSPHDVGAAQQTCYPGLPIDADAGSTGRPSKPLPPRGKRVRICIASYDLVGPVRNGGVGTAFTSLAEALATAGHEVTLLYMSGQFCENRTMDHWVEDYRKKGIRFVPLPEFTSPRIEACWHMTKSYEAYQWLKAQNFDVIHFSEWRAPGYFTILAKHQGLAFDNTTLVVGTHGPTLWSKLSNGDYVTELTDLELDYMERASVRWADVVVSPSQYLFRWMKEQGWILAPNCFVQQNIMPATACRPKSSQDSERTRVKELVFFGRLETRKGIALFCDALDRLQNEPEMRHLQLTFLGKVVPIDGRGADQYLAERAAKWPWKWKIISDCDQPGAMAYLQTPGRLAVIPSKVDNLPYTVLECLGAGIPFLASNVGGIPEMIGAEDLEATCFPLRPTLCAQRILAAVRAGVRPVKLAIPLEETRRVWLGWHGQLATRSTPSLVVQLGNSSPLVSICMSHFNRPEYLRQALASIEAQDYPNLEVVLVDDCSTKPEAIAFIDALAPKFTARSWQIIRNQEELFVGAARNLAARHARGEYLLFMDDDNCAKPHEVSTFIKVAQRTGADIVSCALDFFSTKEAPHPQAVPEFRFLFLGDAAAPSGLRNFLGDTNSLIRRAVFLQLGGFHEERGVGHEDWELFGDAILKGYHLEAVPEALVWYRRLETGLNATRTNSLHAGHMRNIRPYLDAVPPALRNLVLFAQGQIMKHTETATLTDAGPNLQHSVRWRSLLEAGRLLKAQKQNSAALQAYLDAVKAAEDSKHPLLILEALIEIGAGLAKLDSTRATQLLEMGLQLAEKVRCNPAAKKARQLLASINSQTPERSEPVLGDPILEVYQTASPLTPATGVSFSRRGFARSPLRGEGEPVVSIVIPTFNNLPLTKQCLEAILLHTPIPHEIILVDNASTDGTREYLCELQAAGSARLIFNHENLGFAHASNQGARAAEGEFVLFLNNDTVPHAGWLEPLVGVLTADPAVAAAGSKLIYPDGSLQHAGIVICNDEKAQDPLLARLLYRGEAGGLPDANVIRQFQALTAACLLVRKSAFLLVGGFDESYWNGYEDVDLCFKLRERNWMLVYEPASVVTHHESKSGPERFARAQENILRLHQKWLGKIQPDIVVKENGEAQITETSVIRNTSGSRGATAIAAQPGPTPDGSVRSSGPRVSIIILTWNNLAFTRECIESIQRHTAPGFYELIAVDNGSTDGTPDYLRQVQSEHANVRVIANRTNRGFAAGNNQGISVAQGQNILLLNNDTVVTPGWLDRMLAVLERYPDVGLVGPVSNCVSGPQRVLEISYKDLSELPAYAIHRAQRMAGQSGEATRLVGFCLLARREVIERIGGLDQRFGSGNFEDDDFCLRAFSLGFKARIAQDSFVHHAGSQTFKSAKINYQDAMKANWRLFKSKWGISADSPIELGYRLPVQLAAGESLKIALPNIALDHEAGETNRWWQEPASRTAVPAVPAGVSPANINTGETPGRTGGTPVPLARRLELPATARIGSLQGATDLLHQKNFPEAWNNALEAIRCRPFHPEAYLLLGEIAKAAGDFQQARRCAERAAHIAPGLKHVRKFLKSLPGGPKTSAVSWRPLPDNSLPPHLSVCLIVRNEEKFLPQCLKSVRGLAQEIVVVDTGSTDRTVAIAREHGAQVFTFDWNDDFSAARNVALEHATGDWVLVLDADEELLPESREALKKEMQAQPVIAVRLPIVDAGKEDEGCSYVPRLFRNAPGLFFVGRVHEQVFTSIEMRRQEWGLENRLGKAVIRHHGYSTEVKLDRNKIERNLALLKKAIDELPGEPNLLMNYGLELARSGNLRSGLDYYRQAFELMAALPAAQIIPELRETLLTQYSTYLTKNKEYGQLVELLSSPLAKGGLTASLHFAQGLALMELKRFPEAADQMRQCLSKRNRPALSPINKEIRKAGPAHCLAVCLKMMGQKVQAAKALAEALKEEPNSTPLRLDYARFLVEIEQPVEALQSLHQFISDKPDETVAWLLGGEIALSQPRFLEFARDWTGEAIKYFPHERSVLLQRAEALLLSGQIEQSLPFWRQASDAANPRHAAARFLCELLSDCEGTVPPQTETAVSHEFLKWYRALLGVGAAGLLRSIHARFTKLRAGLPLASRALEQALVEAGQELPAERAAGPEVAV